MSNYFNENELEVIKEKITIFYHATGIFCSFVDEEGDRLLSVGEEPPYCCTFQQFVKGDSICKNAHNYAGKQSEALGEGYIFFCPTGLVHFSAAISIGGVYRGALIGGPIQMDDSDPYFFEHELRKYGIPQDKKEKLEQYYEQIDKVLPKRARYLSYLLQIVANEIVLEERAAIQKKKAIYEEHKRISEYLQEAKVNKASSYPIHLEKALVTKIKNGDVIGAKKELNDLLGHIFLFHQASDQKIMAMVMQVVIVMSRAAIDGGATYEQISDFIFDYYIKIFQQQSIEEMVVWTVELLEKIIAISFPIKSDIDENRNIIQKASSYIHNNYSTNITLEEVANYVNLSPTYFSRFFKKQTGMNFSDYLNRIRIEESKKYLSGFDYSLCDVALMIGYTDQSYFSKIFKKYEGITPGKYRKIAK